MFRLHQSFIANNDAREVYLVGDFNGWHPSNNSWLMKFKPEGNFWETEVTFCDFYACLLYAEYKFYVVPDLDRAYYVSVDNDKFNPRRKDGKYWFMPVLERAVYDLLGSNNNRSDAWALIYKYYGRDGLLLPEITAYDVYLARATTEAVARHFSREQIVKFKSSASSPLGNDDSGDLPLGYEDIKTVIDALGHLDDLSISYDDWVDSLAGLCNTFFAEELFEIEQLRQWGELFGEVPAEHMQKVVQVLFREKVYNRLTSLWMVLIAAVVFRYPDTKYLSSDKDLALFVKKHLGAFDNYIKCEFGKIAAGEFTQLGRAGLLYPGCLAQTFNQQRIPWDQAIINEFKPAKLVDVLATHSMFDLLRKWLVAPADAKLPFDEICEILHKAGLSNEEAGAFIRQLNDRKIENAASKEKSSSPLVAMGIVISVIIVMGIIWYKYFYKKAAKSVTQEINETGLSPIEIAELLRQHQGTRIGLTPDMPVEVLLAGLGNKDEDVRVSAAQILGARKNITDEKLMARVIDALIGLFAVFGRTSRAAVDAIIAIREPAFQVIADLAVQKEDWAKRYWAFYILGEWKITGAVDAFIKSLVKERSSMISLVAEDGLIKINEPAFQKLAALLKPGMDIEVRKTVLSILDSGKWFPQESADRAAYHILKNHLLCLCSLVKNKMINTAQLLAWLEDSDPVIRRRILNTISVCRLEEAGERILNALTQEADRDCRIGVIKAAGALKITLAAAKIIPLLEERDAGILKVSARALGEIGDKSAVDALRRLVMSEVNNEVVLAAGEALISLGDTELSDEELAVALRTSSSSPTEDNTKKCPLSLVFITSRSGDDCRLPYITGSIADGRYDIIISMGSGTYSRVYRGWDSEKKEVVAIKHLDPKMLESPEAKWRLKREIATMRVLDSPHIIKFLDRFPVSLKQPPEFLILSFAPGRDLSEFLPSTRFKEERGKQYLSDFEAIRVIIEVCKAVEVMHKHKIIHRDLKPDNIRLEREKVGVTLVDFGYAKKMRLWNAERERHKDLGFGTKTGTGIGTPYYMSPEQIMDSKYVSFSSEVYNLGMILLQMLSGIIPTNSELDTDSGIMIGKRHLLADYPDPAEFPNIDKDMAAIIRRMLALRFPGQPSHYAIDPRARPQMLEGKPLIRYGTVIETRIALENYCESHGIPLLPTSSSPLDLNRRDFMRAVAAGALGIPAAARAAASKPGEVFLILREHVSARDLDVLEPVFEAAVKHAYDMGKRVVVFLEEMCLPTTKEGLAERSALRLGYELDARLALSNADVLRYAYNKMITEPFKILNEAYNDPNFQIENVVFNEFILRRLEILRQLQRKYKNIILIIEPHSLNTFHRAIELVLAKEEQPNAEETLALEQQLITEARERDIVNYVREYFPREISIVSFGSAHEDGFVKAFTKAGFLVHPPFVTTQDRAASEMLQANGRNLLELRRELAKLEAQANQTEIPWGFKAVAGGCAALILLAQIMGTWQKRHGSNTKDGGKGIASSPLLSPDFMQNAYQAYALVVVPGVIFINGCLAFRLWFSGKKKQAFALVVIPVVLATPLLPEAREFFSMLYDWFSKFDGGITSSVGAMVGGKFSSSPIEGMQVEAGSPGFVAGLSKDLINDFKNTSSSPMEADSRRLRAEFAIEREIMETLIRNGLSAGDLRILIVCERGLCRSPTWEYWTYEFIKACGLQGVVRVSSGGVGLWEEAPAWGLQALDYHHLSEDGHEISEATV
ncbi:MAG: protein kinase, partial [Candidatus Omnitrophica bacterium]|nr:protein kinase [Candidatus Omnitrophota bacterium]